LQLEFTDLETGTKKSYEFEVRNPYGGLSGIKFEDIILSPGKTYICEVYLLNESVSPPEDITLEVEEEGVDHQIYFTSTVNGLSITYLDKDEKGLDLGLESKWITGAAATGIVNVTLKHKPGTKAANDPIAKGDTDVSIGFNVKVQ
jgi:hypothetical protein